jgi:serine O-acetyltransferase
MSSQHPVPVFRVNEVVDGLRRARQDWRLSQGRTLEPGGRELPSSETLAEILRQLRGILFPMRLGPPDLHQASEDFYIGYTLDKVLHDLLGQIKLELEHNARHAHLSGFDLEVRAQNIVQSFADSLPSIRRLLDTDVRAAFQGDPAAHSVDEVLLCYPGVLAVTYHRLAHVLYELGATLLARMISELAHGQTGIDIHPGATIGEGFFIDHGTGVVIGETAVIGRNVRLYQAVTLGAKSFQTDEDGSLTKGLPRHPHVEDDVVIYAGATVLGRVTIGQGSTIGGNVWLTHSVPPNSRISQAQTREHGELANHG